MSNHYRCSVDITTEPYYCTDHEVYLADDGSELDADNLEQDWHNAPVEYA